MPTDELTYFYIFIDFISIIYIFETQQTKIAPFRRFPAPDLSKSLGSLWNMKVQDLIILNISSLASNERS